jgi:hypothetical protein
MKKIKILITTSIFLAILISACSKDDDTTNSSSSFNPPNWIIGTWLDESEPEWQQVGGFKFTNHSIIDLDVDGNEIINYAEGLKATLKTGLTKIEEIKTDDTYHVKVTTSGVTSINYKYYKGGSNTIIYELNSIYDIELTKQ